MLLNYKINMLGFSNIVQAFYEHLKERQQGRIVVTASIAAFRHALRLPHYTASKAALLAFMKTMAVELGNYNVNAIAPGWVYTPIYHNAISMKQRDPERFKDCNTSEEVMQKLAERTALPRAQTVDDMAYAIMFLCSESAKNITGHCIPIESGVLVMP